MAGEPDAGTSNTISGGVYTGPVLQGRDFDVTFRAAAVAPVALVQLPPPVAGFTGRGGELEAIIGFLDPESAPKAVVVSAVAGLAGVGKTALAVTAGHAVWERGWYSGGVLFIDLHGYDNQYVEPGQALDALLRALGVSGEHIPPGTEARSALYRSVLAQSREPVLILADNASSEAQVRPLLPGSGLHRVLVTSRDTLAGLQARLLDVTVLDEAASVQLLAVALRAARTDDDRVSGDQEAAAQVARMCGGLPLALQIVAALLKADPTLSTSELAEELARKRNRLKRLRYDDGSNGGELSVEVAFELSYRRLQPGPARVFRMLVVNPGPDVSTESAVVLADQGFSKVRRSLSYLAKAHMIEAGPSAAGRWRMHDLVRLYAQRLSDTHADTDRRDQARYRLFSYYINMTQAAVFHLLTFSGVPGPGQFTGRDDASAWLDAERSSLVAAVGMADRLGMHQAAFELSRVLVEYLSWHRYVDEWVGTATAGLNAARSLGDQQSEADALNNLGLALQAIRRFGEAVAFHRDAAAISRRIGNRPLEGIALHNLGMALQDLRLWAEAIDAYRQDLAICQKAGDRPGEGKTLNSLSICMQEAGHLAEGIEVSKNAAAIFQAIGDRQGEGMALVNISAGLRSIGQLDDAITAGKNGSSLLREVGDRYHEALALVTLGGALGDAGQYDEATATCQDAAAIFREIGDLHGEGMALSNLAASLAKVQRLDDAIATYEDSLDNFRKTSDRHKEGGALRNLGITLQQAERLDEAIAAHRDAAVIFREVGDKHSEGIALKDLGVALGTAGRMSEAITAGQSAAALLRDTGSRRDEGTTLYNLGFSLREAQRSDDAIGVLQDAAATFHETGDQHGEGRALGLLTALLGERGEHDQAIVAGQTAAAIFRQIGDRRGEGNALHNLGSAFRHAERFDEAIGVLQDAAAILHEIGDRHGEVVTLNNLGAALTYAGRVEEAASVHRQAAGIFKKTNATLNRANEDT
jgi:tetratricopeptide (TPR) repeat protein